MKKTQYIEIGGVILLMVLLIIIFYFTPYCLDEWRWGGVQRLNMLKTGFSGYNGRYLGNILSLIISRYNILKTLIMLICLLALTYQICIFSGLTKTKYYYTILLVALLVPQKLYQQIYGWPAAFVNFVPPIILLLLLINTLKKNQKVTLPLGCYIFILGLSMQFFSEHNTIFNLLLAICIFVCYLIKNKIINLQHVLFLTSTVLGTILMFMNSAYTSISYDTNGHKSIVLNLKSVILKYIYEISDSLVLNNVLINLTIAILIFIIYKFVIKKYFCIAIYNFVFVMYSIVRTTFPNIYLFGSEAISKYTDSLLSALFLASIFYFVIKIADVHFRLKLSLLLISYIVISMPLVIANPIGPRCFFSSYIILILFMLELAKFVFSKIVFDKQKFVLASKLFVFLYLFLLCYVFISIHIVGVENKNSIVTNVDNNSNTVHLKYLPYDKFYWTTVPSTKSWEDSYKLFYGIPKDMSIEFYDY